MLNGEIIKTVQELTNKYGSVIHTDSRKLKSFLSDYYSDKYIREKRLLVDSVEQKIPEEIINCKENQIDDFLYNKLAGKLFDNLGISKDFAEETIDAWCEIFNKRHIKVVNNSSSNVNNNSYGQMNPGAAVNHSQQNSSSNTAFMNNSSVINNNNYSKTRPGSAANHSQQNSSSNTVFMNNPTTLNNNYGQTRPGAAANYSQQNYSSNTAYIDNSYIKNSPFRNFLRKVKIMGILLIVLAVVATVAYLMGSIKGITSKNVADAAKETKEIKDTTSNQNNAVTKNNTDDNTNIKQTDTQQTNTQPKSNSFIFSDSSINKIQQNQLYRLNSDQLFIARNEIFARHGYIFNDKKLQNYFESQAWYKPNPSAKGDTSDEIEKYNAKLIMDMEEVKLAFKDPSSVTRQFVFNNSHIVKLTADQIERLSDLEILIARNEIYARHGYAFGIPELNSYFQSKGWYIKSTNDVTLDQVEEYNVELIKAIEEKRVNNMLSNYQLGSSY